MTTTTNKGLTDPANGSLNWDVPLNANFDIIDAALGSTTTIDVTSVGTGAVTLTATQYQSMIISFTGTLTANVTYQVPSGVGGQWIMRSTATGAYTITFRTAAVGTSTTIPASANGVRVYSNGTNVYTTGGTVVDTSGNVGIGTASPANKLEVYGNSTYVTQVIRNQSTTSATSANLAIGANNGTQQAQLITNYNTGGSNFNITSFSSIPTIYTDFDTQVFRNAAGIERLNISSSGTVTISNLAGTGSRTVTASSTGLLAAASDSRLKQEVPEASIPGLAEVMQLRPVAYKWLDDIEKRGDEATVEVGFFANEAKDVIPSAAPLGQDGYYGFYDRAVIAALVKSVQELTARVAALEANPQT